MKKFVLVLLIISFFSPLKTSPFETKSVLDENSQKHVLSDEQEKYTQSKKAIALRGANVALGLGLMGYYCYLNPECLNNINRYKNLRTCIPELICNAASAVVDIKPSTANSIVGWINVAWMATKIIAIATGDFIVGSSTNVVIPHLYVFSSISANVMNAGYRLWVGGNINTAKK